MIVSSLGLNDLPRLRSKPPSSLTWDEKEYVRTHRDTDVTGMSDIPTLIETPEVRDRRIEWEIWGHRQPDQWTDRWKQTFIERWRKSYGSYSRGQVYELLLNDEGYWYTVNGLIANLPLAPEAVHSSIEDTFYNYTVPWNGVCADWINDSTVTATVDRQGNGEIIRDPIRTLYLAKHQRPQGMGVELSWKKATERVSKEGGDLWTRNKKMLDAVGDIVEGAGKTAKGIGNTLDPADNAPLRFFSFATLAVVLGVVASVALYVR